MRGQSWFGPAKGSHAGAVPWDSFIPSYNPNTWFKWEEALGASIFYSTDVPIGWQLNASSSACTTAAIKTPTGRSQALNISALGAYAGNQSGFGDAPEPWTQLIVAKVASVSNGNAGGGPLIACDSTNSSCGCTIFVGQNGSVSFYYSSSTAWPPASGPNFAGNYADDNWHLFMLASDTTGYHFWVDDTDLTGDVAYANSTFQWTVGGSAIQVGAGPSGFGTPGEMTGWISDLVVIPARLGSTDHQKIWNSLGL